jgi:hypothetical protein
LVKTLKASGMPGFGIGQTFDDGFVALAPSDPIIALDGEHLLQGMGGPVSFEGPNLHFAETLAAILGFATERLLRD